jgi:tripeptidyl-peptidase-1
MRVATLISLFLLPVLSLALHSWVSLRKTPSDHKMIFGIVLKQKNQDLIEKMFYERSDPDHSLYGQWLSAEELAEITRTEGAEDRVRQFIEEKGGKIIHRSRFGEYLKVEMTSEVVEEVFSAQVMEYGSSDFNFKISRAEKYVVPMDLEWDIEYIEHLDYFPVFDARKAPLNLSSNEVTNPKLIFDAYGIPYNLKVTNKNATQALFESIGQQFSPSDLRNFQNEFNLTRTKIEKYVGPNDPSVCLREKGNCSEANLDVQYILAVAQGASTWYWNAPADLEPFTEWIFSVNDLENPPLVHSVSYGNYETDYPLKKIRAFNTVAQKLGLRGVTILVASMDDGAALFRARNDSSKCGYNSAFPSSSPFVTSVGATQGPEAGKQEIACSSRAGGVITTGGGFSTIFSIPPYQKKQVESYLSGIKNRIPPGYANGRGSPDIAALGHNYVIALGGGFGLVSGTSASTPVIAGMITLINDHRLKNGKSSLGFLNPALYKADASIWNDITEGESFCTATHTPGAGCCPQGFYATKGWDPLTGLGTPKFSKLLQYLGNLQ